MAIGFFWRLAPSALVVCFLAFAASPQQVFASQVNLEELSKRIESLAAEMEKIRADSQRAPAPSPRTDVDELMKRIEVLAEEVQKLKLGEVAEAKYESYSGLGPAASKVYGALPDRLSMGGYGEIIYSNYRHDSVKDFADAYRFILYAGYKFNDKIIMNTELEFEHAGIKNIGGSESGVTPAVSNSRTSEVYVEFSYLDFLISKPFNVRTGLVLMPIGFLNEYHEPTVYHGVLRPDVETNIIPSTWRELGVMAYGELGKLSYNVALVNGLRADKFNASGWLRSGRQQGAEINANSAAGLININYEVRPELKVGGSYYIGDAVHGRGKDTHPLGAGEKEARVSLWEAHADFNYKGFHLRGLYAMGKMDGNAAFTAAPPGSVGREAQGWYVETAYDVAPHLLPNPEMSLSPFVRYELYDTNKDTFSGFARNKSMDREVVTVGIGFKPHPNVVLKGDYQWRDTESSLVQGKTSGRDQNKVDQFNLGLGFIF